MALYSGEDVLKLAIELERRGQDLYRLSLTRAENPQLKTLFDYLLGEEIKHEKIFQNLMEELSAGAQIQKVADFTSYLQALYESYLLVTKSKASKLIEAVEKPEDLLKAAFVFEKEIILFFHELRRYIPESDHPILEQVIREEHNHLIRINQLHTRLSSRRRNQE